MAEGDGVKIMILSHGPAGMILERDAYLECFQNNTQKFFSSLASATMGSFVDVLPAVKIPRYAISDTIHLNTYGAKQYTKAAFMRFYGDEKNIRRESFQLSSNYESPSLASYPADDPTFSPYAAVFLREPHEPHKGVRVELVESMAVPPLPKGAEFSFALRKPDDTDLIIPAKRTGNNSFESEFELAEASKTQVYIFRLLAFVGGRKVALNAPVQSFSWIN